MNDQPDWTPIGEQTPPMSEVSPADPMSRLEIWAYAFAAVVAWAVTGLFKVLALKHLEAIGGAFAGVTVVLLAIGHADDLVSEHIGFRRVTALMGSITGGAAVGAASYAGAGLVGGLLGGLAIGLYIVYREWLLTGLPKWRSEIEQLKRWVVGLAGAWRVRVLHGAAADVLARLRRTFGREHPH